MTVIAYKDGIMVADGGDWNGGIVRQVAFPKIARAPDGSLWGACGSAGDCYLLREWVLAGCDMKAKPFFVGKDDEQIGIVMAKPDGSLWGGTSALMLRPCPAPTAYGAPSASCFCEGAMQAGLSAVEAMRLTIQHCEYAFGEMQVEQLNPVLAAQVRKPAPTVGEWRRQNAASMQADLGGQSYIGRAE